MIENLYYILDENKKPVPCDMIEMEGFFKNPDRIVKQETTNSGYWISTVFLGINHNYTGEGPPVLFETLVTDPGGEQCLMDRYHTWEEAEQSHKMYIEKYSDLNLFVCFCKLIRGKFKRMYWVWLRWKQVKHYKKIFKGFILKGRSIQKKLIGSKQGRKGKKQDTMEVLFPPTTEPEEKLGKAIGSIFPNLIPPHCPTEKRLIEPEKQSDGRYMITLNHHFCPGSAFDIADILEKASGVKWHTSGCFMDVCAYYTKEKVEPFEIDFPWMENEPEGAEGS